MACALLPLQTSLTITVDISKTQTTSTTIYKISIIAAKTIRLNGRWDRKRLSNSD